MANYGNFYNASVPPSLANIVQSKQLSPTYSTAIADPMTDLQWGFGYLNHKPPHTYFDYYFTGQDVNVYIQGAQDHPMPIIEFGYGIQQQKQPVYGFWSWRHDAVMRGTRIVNGMFRIATTSTDYMADKVSQAASSRLAGSDQSFVRGLNIDESLIETYWARNFNDDTIGQQQRNIFSSHPPFNFAIVYGFQSATLYNTSTSSSDLYNSYKENTPLMTDTNERLIEVGPEGNMQYIIEEVELTGMQTEYNVDGQVCSEVYSFFARDMYSPK